MINKWRIFLPLILAIFFVSCSGNVANFYNNTNFNYIDLNNSYSNYHIQMFEPESNYDETFSLEEEYEKLSKVNRSIIDKILLEAKVWKYTPYKLGGSNQNTGGDCSSFVRYVFNNAFGIILARSTAEQRLGGVAVSKKNLKAGDLVFFKTGRGRNGMHVGIYLENKSFIHLSSKGGTRVQNLDSKYWKNRYLSARRYNGVK